MLAAVAGHSPPPTVSRALTVARGKFQITHRTYIPSNLKVRARIGTRGPLLENP